MSDEMVRAETSDLGGGVITFSEETLDQALSGIRTACDDYRTEYNNLVSYFDNDLSQAIQGQVLDAFRECFDGKKPALKAVFEHIDDLCNGILSGKNQGASEAEDIISKLKG